MHTPISIPAARTLLVAAILFVTVAATTSAAAPLKVGATPAAVAPGGTVAVEYALQRSPAKLALRLDGEALKTVTVRRARGRITVAVPRDATAGPHRLSVCVGKRCRTLPLRVTSKAQPGPGAPRPSSPPPPASAPQVPGSPLGDDFTGAPNPLEVEANTDASRRATATLGIGGGTLETTAADGTHYELTVPFGALLSSERISMAPITSADGLPFSGGLVAGVQLEPSGLRFNEFVTLEISGHPPVSAQQATGFLYQRDGVEFQLYPEQPGPATEFKLIHFSGVGIASGTEAERNAQLLRATQDVEGRLYQRLATYFRPEGIDREGVEATLRAYHDQALKPLITAALVDDGLAIQAIQRYIAFARMLALLNYEDFMVAERQVLADQWVEVMKNAAIKAHRRCVEGNRPEELPAILSWWRNFALASEDPPPDLWGAISGCARFELDFHTKVTQKHEFHPEGPEVWTGEAIAENVIIEPDPHSLEQRGGKDAQYVDFRVQIPPHKPGTGCWRGGGEWESTFPFTVSRLMIDLNPIQRPDGTYGYPELERGKIAVSVLPFFVREYQFFADCGGATGAGGWSLWLAPTFLALHEDQVEENGGIVFTDWTVPEGGGSMLGAKTYFRTVTVDEHETREETTLELYHAPLR